MLGEPKDIGNQKKQKKFKQQLIVTELSTQEQILDNLAVI